MPTDTGRTLGQSHSVFARATTPSLTSMFKAPFFEHELHEMGEDL